MTDVLAEIQNAPASRSMWQDAWTRFFRNRASVISLFVMAAIFLFAIFGNMFAVWSNEEIDWSVLGQIAELGAPRLENGHYFGVDPLGRDLYARMVQGSRVSLLVAFIAPAISIVISLGLGMIAAWYGRTADMVIMRSAEIIIVIPYLIFYIVILAVIGRSIANIILVMGLTNWMTGTFLVRGQVLSLKHKEYIDAARMLGLSNFQILMRHILPNLLGIMIVYMSISIPNVILFESLLSFLGMGVVEPDTSWGALLSEGAANMQYGTLWQFFIPFTFFGLSMMALFYIGDGLRDAFDPKDR